MIALILLLWQVSMLGRPGPFDRPGYYHPLKSVRELPWTQWTHVRFTAYVVAVIEEDDGDLHLRLSDGTVAACRPMHYADGRCVVGEIRPDRRGTMPEPKRGDTVYVKGISRYDREHHWAELHPIDALAIVACADNSDPPCR